MMDTRGLNYFWVGWYASILVLLVTHVIDRAQILQAKVDWIFHHLHKWYQICQFQKRHLCAMTFSRRNLKPILSLSQSLIQLNSLFSFCFTFNEPYFPSATAKIPFRFVQHPIQNWSIIKDQKMFLSELIESIYFMDA